MGAVHGVHQGRAGHDVLDLVALQVPDEVPYGPRGELAVQSGALVAQLLGVVLAKMKLPRRRGLQQLLGRARLGHGDELNGVWVAAGLVTGALNPVLNRREALGEGRHDVLASIVNGAGSPRRVSSSSSSASGSPTTLE